MSDLRTDGTERPSKDEVFLRIAETMRFRSRDATTKVGAVVCTEDYRIVGTGYNGPPAGSPDSLPMAGPERHAWVIHAEVNALLQAVAALGTNKLVGCLLFSTHRPCAACLRMAFHLGIINVRYRRDQLSEEQKVAAGVVETTLALSVHSLTSQKANREDNQILQGFVSEQRIALTKASGRLPDATLSGGIIAEDTRPCVYVWKKRNVCLYIGATSQGPVPRLRAHHVIGQAEALEVYDSIEIYWCESKDAALILEKDLTRELQPKYNRAFSNPHRGGSRKRKRKQ